MKSTRVIYYSQFPNNQCTVVFGLYKDDLTKPSRHYGNVTKSSKDRLSNLVMWRVARVTAHLSPYMSIWAVFSSDSMKGK